MGRLDGFLYYILLKIVENYILLKIVESVFSGNLKCKIF